MYFPILPTVIQVNNCRLFFFSCCAGFVGCSVRPPVRIAFSSEPIKPFHPCGVLGFLLMWWRNSYPSIVVKDTENCVEPQLSNNFASLQLLWNIYALIKWIFYVCTSYPWYFLLHWNMQSCVVVQLPAAGLRSPSTTQLCFNPQPAPGSGVNYSITALTGNIGKEAKESGNPVPVAHISRMSLKTKFSSQVSV